MVLLIIILKISYGPMKAHEQNAINGDIYTVKDRVFENTEFSNENPNGRASDLVVPVIILIIFCAAGMLYTGGFFSGTNFIEAFSGSDASVGLSIGSLFALIFTIIYYIARKIVTFGESMECIPEGFKAMVPAILILTFAWTLKAMTDSLGAAEYVAGIMESGAESLMSFLPAIIFLVGCVLAFATGTSWGTFGILIPIVVSMFAGVDETMMIMSISACMAGAVCGDHCSPISDTTIMSSAGAQCDHISHVSTQLPYAITVAAVSFIGYVLTGVGYNITGMINIIWFSMPISIVLLASVLLIIRNITKIPAEAEA